MIERKKKSVVVIFFFMYFGGAVRLWMFFLGPFMVLGVPMRIELAQVLFITTNRIPNQVLQISPFTMTSTHGQWIFSQLSDFPSSMLLS
jgi:hypothetical protein